LPKNRAHTARPDYRQRLRTLKPSKTSGNIKVESGVGMIIVMIAPRRRNLNRLACRDELRSSSS
jgi:hypothetical protein